MKNLANKPNAFALVQQIKLCINRNGLLYRRGQSCNTPVLIGLGITPLVQGMIIETLTADDYCESLAPEQLAPWSLIAGFVKPFAGIPMGIKISIGMPCAPAFCLEFAPRVSV
jgi:hypothetical protein